MKFDDYQRESAKTLINAEDSFKVLVRTVLGINGEAGEVAEKLKKIMRDKDGKLSAEDKAAMADELGDILWYMARLADLTGYNLSQVAQMNLDKVMSRQARGKISGSGDKR